MHSIENTIELVTISSIERDGAILHRSSNSEIFLPFHEQKGHLQVGDKVIVLFQKDADDQIYATEKFERIFSERLEKFEINQVVDLLIYAKTDLGYKAIIDQKAFGVVYKNEVFEELHYGQKVKGAIKKVREDGKIDLLLRPPGHKATEDIGLKIIELLEDHNGFYNLTDKTAPEKIYELFGVSKKKYKIALGGLYKLRIISVTDQGITLQPKSQFGD